MEENKNLNQLNDNSKGMKNINENNDDDKKMFLENNKDSIEKSSGDESDINKALQRNNIEEEKTIEEIKEIKKGLNIKDVNPVPNNTDINRQNRIKTNFVYK